MRHAFFAQLYSFRPFFTSFGCFAFRVLVVSLLLLPGRGPHSWLGGVRSSSPAWIDVDAIIGDGPGFFCSMVTGLSGQSARGAKKKIAAQSQGQRRSKPTQPVAMQRALGFLADAEESLEHLSSCLARDVIVSEAQASEQSRRIVDARNALNALRRQITGEHEEVCRHLRDAQIFF